jgi:DNA-binding winged helix-turn-helix (wHTH) protein/TolB-like protein
VAEFIFDNCKFTAETGKLTTSAGNTRLEPTIARLLEYLINNQDRLVTRDELAENVWQGRIVSDDPINRGISVLRQALDPHNKNTYIKTVPKKGYQASFSISTSPQSKDSSVEAHSKQTHKPQTNEQNSIDNQSSGFKGKWVIAFSIIVCAIIIWGVLAKFTNNVNKEAPVLAVLPLVSIETINSQSELGLGIADAIIDLLSRVQDIQVISRTSSFAFNQSNTSIEEIAKKLEADYVLEGSIKASNNEGAIEISLRLIDTRNNTLVWSSIFAKNQINDKRIAFEIANEAVKGLAGSILTRGFTEYQADFPSYQQVMLGRQAYGLQTSDSLQVAIRHFDQAISLDPEYGLPYALKAKSLISLNKIDPLLYEYQSDLEHLQYVDILLNDALKRQPYLSEVYSLKSEISLQQRNYEEALTHSRSALLFDSTNALAQTNLARAFFALNRTLDALIEINKAKELDPQDSNARLLSARILWQLGQSEQAIDELKQNLELNPNASNTLSLLSRWSFQIGQPFDGVKYASLEWQLEPNNPNKHWRMCIAIIQIWEKQKGLDCINALLQLAPDYYEAKKWKYGLMKEDQKQLALMRNQVQRFPRVSYFKLQLAEKQLKLKMFAQAADMLKALYPQLTSQTPVITDRNIWGARMLAWSFLNLDSEDQGVLILNLMIEHIDRTRKLQSGGFSSGVDDVNALAALGNVDEALNRLEKAINNDWMFYSYSFFTEMDIDALSRSERFLLLKKKQALKMNAIQKRVEKELAINFN